MGVPGFLQERECGVGRPGRYKQCKQQLLSWLDRLAAAPVHNKPCQFSGETRSTFLVDFSCDGKRVASTHGDHSVRVCDAAMGKVTHVLKGHPRTPWCLAFHPTHSDILASGCLGGQVRIWDLRGGGSEVYSTDTSLIASLTFHPMDRLLVFSTRNKVYFWDWTHSSPLTFRACEKEYETVRWVKFDTHGQYLLTGICNGTNMARSYEMLRQRQRDQQQVNMESGADPMGQRRLVAQTRYLHLLGLEPYPPLFPEQERPNSPDHEDRLRHASEYARYVTSRVREMRERETARLPTTHYNLSPLPHIERYQQMHLQRQLLERSYPVAAPPSSWHLNSSRRRFLDNAERLYGSPWRRAGTNSPPPQPHVDNDSDDDEPFPRTVVGIGQEVESMYRQIQGIHNRREELRNRQPRPEMNLTSRLSAQAQIGSGSAQPATSVSGGSSAAAGSQEGDTGQWRAWGSTFHPSSSAGASSEPALSFLTQPSPRVPPLPWSSSASLSNRISSAPHPWTIERPSTSASVPQPVPPPAMDESSGSSGLLSFSGLSELYFPGSSRLSTARASAGLPTLSFASTESSSGQSSGLSSVEPPGSTELSSARPSGLTDIRTSSESSSGPSSARISELSSRVGCVLSAGSRPSLPRPPCQIQLTSSTSPASCRSMAMDCSGLSSIRTSSESLSGPSFARTSELSSRVGCVLSAGSRPSVPRPPLQLTSFTSVAACRSVAVTACASGQTAGTLSQSLAAARSRRAVLARLMADEEAAFAQGVSSHHTSSTSTSTSAEPGSSTTSHTPSTIDHTYSNTNHALSASDQTPSATDQTPSTSEQAPSTSEQVPSTSDQTPSSSEQVPSTNGYTTCDQTGLPDDSDIGGERGSGEDSGGRQGSKRPYSVAFAHSPDTDGELSASKLRAPSAPASDPETGTASVSSESSMATVAESVYVAHKKGPPTETEKNSATVTENNLTAVAENNSATVAENSMTIVAEINHATVTENNVPTEIESGVGTGPHNGSVTDSENNSASLEESTSVAPERESSIVAAIENSLAAVIENNLVPASENSTTTTTTTTTTTNNNNTTTFTTTSSSSVSGTASTSSSAGSFPSSYLQLVSSSRSDRNSYRSGVWSCSYLHRWQRMMRVLPPEEQARLYNDMGQMRRQVRLGGHVCNFYLHSSSASSGYTSCPVCFSPRDSLSHNTLTDRRRRVRLQAARAAASSSANSNERDRLLDIVLYPYLQPEGTAENTSQTSGDLTQPQRADRGTDATDLLHDPSVSPALSLQAAERAVRDARRAARDRRRAEPLIRDRVSRTMRDRRHRNIMRARAMRERSNLWMERLLENHTTYRPPPPPMPSGSADTAGGAPNNRTSHGGCPHTDSISAGRAATLASQQTGSLDDARPTTGRFSSLMLGTYEPWVTFSSQGTETPSYWAAPSQSVPSSSSAEGSVPRDSLPPATSAASSSSAGAVPSASTSVQAAHEEEESGRGSHSHQGESSRASENGQGESERENSEGESSGGSGSGSVGEGGPFHTLPEGEGEREDGIQVLTGDGASETISFRELAQRLANRDDVLVVGNHRRLASADTSASSSSSSSLSSSSAAASSSSSLSVPPSTSAGVPQRSDILRSCLDRPLRDRHQPTSSRGPPAVTAGSAFSRSVPSASTSSSASSSTSSAPWGRYRSSPQFPRLPRIRVERPSNDAEEQARGSTSREQEEEEGGQAMVSGGGFMPVQDSLHPHYSRSVMDAPVFGHGGFPSFQSTFNSAIAGTGVFMSSGEQAVASNIVSSTFRIQRWDMRHQLPDLTQREANVVVHNSKIHNEASIDISQDSSLLATFVHIHGGFPDENILAVFSLRPQTLGQCLYTKSFGPNAISVSISPSNQYLMVGLASKRMIFFQVAEQQLVGQVYQMVKEAAGEDSMKHKTDVYHPVQRTGPLPRGMAPVSLNSARWLPTIGEGLVYGTNHGDLNFFRSGRRKKDVEKEELKPRKLTVSTQTGTGVIHCSTCTQTTQDQQTQGQ